MKPIRKDLFWRGLQWGLGGVFIAASYYKIISPGAFAHQIYNYKILGPMLINPLAIVLPWIQLFCGLALIFNRWARAAAVLITSMIFVFQIALGAALLRGLNVACGCFKAGGASATWVTFSRDTGLLFLALLLSWHLFRSQNQKTT